MDIRIDYDRDRLAWVAVPHVKSKPLHIDGQLVFQYFDNKHEAWDVIEDFRALLEEVEELKMSVGLSSYKE